MRNVFPGSFLLFALLVVGSVDAQTVRAMKQHVESSMLVTGKIDVDATGAVESVALDKVEALPSGIVDFVRNAAMQWRFEPMTNDAGVPVAASAPMNVRVVARKLDEEKVEIALSSASFTRYDPEDRSAVAYGHQQPPSYPVSAVRAGVSGDTYHVLKVGRDGRVEDVAVRQVNLRVLANERSMRRWRKELASASERTLKTWTFRVPTEGAEADAPYWLVTVPVRYRLRGNDGRPQSERYGAWSTYVRGPVQPLPWIDPSDVRNTMSPDALADGGVYMEREGGLKLLTPLDQG